MTPDDAALPLLAKRGDRHAFALLVERYYPRGLRFAQQMLGNPQDAEEAVQDTFVRVFDNLSRFREDARFDPWFFRILSNRCRSLFSKQQRHRDFIEYGDVPLDAAGRDVPFDDMSAEVYAALNELPTEQREAFLLRHVEDMSYEDIAVITNVGLSAVRMRVKRACDALRKMLSEVELHG